MQIIVTGLRGMPNVMGGVETHCEELLPRIAALDSSLSITVAGRRPYLPDVASEGIMFSGVRVVPVSSTKGARTEALSATLASIIMAVHRRADLIHIHAIGPALLAPIAKMLGRRVVVTHHGADYDRAKWGRVARASLRMGEQAAIAFADAIIAVSPSLAKELAMRFPKAANRIHYIPNGAPTLPECESSAADTLKRFGLEPGNYILTVGRLVPEKGTDYLIRAFRSSGTPRKLVIAGGSDHDSPFARSINNEADNTVRLLGIQPRPVLRHLYENAGLFVLPSFHEGLPISALEAAQCGTPMLLSDIPANRDIGLDADHYFAVGDEVALAALLTKPTACFQIDRASIAARFDWDVIAKDTLALYRKAAR